MDTLNKPLSGVAIAVVMILGIGGIVFMQKHMAIGGAVATSTNGTSAQTIAAQVAYHSTRASCWTIINDNVYDLTSWIPQHPGGEDAILRLCGKDGSQIFNRQHGGKAQQATILAGFKIGVVEEASAAPLPAAQSGTANNDDVNGDE